MYESFYGLKEKPFNLSPDPGFLYMSRDHENAYVHLQYAVRENKGFVVVTGEVGSGKTTLINFLLHSLLKGAVVGLVNHTSLGPEQFLRMVCEEFEIDVPTPDKAVMLKAIHEFLLAQYTSGRRVVLIIDEAQNLPARTTEEIRMLSNLESEKSLLLQIIMAGQPELQLLFERPELRQFRQRIAVSCHLGALNEVEVKEYVIHRLRVAGAEDTDLFDDEAMEAVYRHSGGIPRLINLVCDSALVVGYADGERRIGKDVVDEAVNLRKFREDLGDPKGSHKARGGPVIPGERRGPPGEEALDGIEERLGALESGVNDLTRKVARLVEGQEGMTRLLRDINRLLSKSASAENGNGLQGPTAKTTPHVFSLFGKRKA